MAKQLTDDEQNLRRKARRRLIGAVALTLVVVVVLPMVLDSEPRPAVQDIELRIPAPDKVGEFVPGVAVSEVVETPPAASAAVAVTAPASTAPVAAIPASAAIADGPVAAPQDKPVEAKPAATHENTKQLPVKTQPAASAQPLPKAADKPADSEGFVAQVGAYASTGAAKQEFDRLKKLGFRKVYTEKADGMTRVRVGPYAEREKAEEVRQMLEKHGLKPVVMGAR